MRRLLTPALVIALATLAFAPAAAVADPNNQHATFELHLEVANVAQAPNGDRISVTGGGVFAVHPKSVTASGAFTHTNSGGTVVGSGTWTATKLISFEFYGCGVIPALDVTLPSNLCGGALKLRVNLTPTGTTTTLRGILTIFCIIGPQAPTPHSTPSGEGIRLVVPGTANFNKLVSGMNVYVRTS